MQFVCFYVVWGWVGSWVGQWLERGKVEGRKAVCWYRAVCSSCGLH